MATPRAVRAATDPVWTRVLASLSTVRTRPEIVLAEAPAPSRLAPYAVAIGAEAHDPDVPGSPAGAGAAARDRDLLADGRFVVLYDPAGQETWQGTLRVVTFASGAVELDLAEDPLLTDVGWSWLTEALDAAGARRCAESGTVTRTASRSYGAIADRGRAGDVEVRASWTAIGDDLATHLQAWMGLVASIAGLPPHPVGVSPPAPPRQRDPS